MVIVFCTRNCDDGNMIACSSQETSLNKILGVVRETPLEAYISIVHLPCFDMNVGSLGAVTEKQCCESYHSNQFDEELGFTNVATPPAGLPGFSASAISPRAISLGWFVPDESTSPSIGNIRLCFLDEGL